MKFAYSLSTGSSFSESGTVVKGYLIGILLLIVLFYFALWFLKSYRKGLFGKQGGRLKVLERLMLSRDTAVCIVKVNEKYLLLSVSNTAVTLIKELDKEDFESIPPEDTDKNDADFKRSFTQCLKDKLMNGGKR